jgi:hypothetical protein
MAHAINEIVHAVHVAKESRFYTTRGTDQIRDLILGDGHVDPKDRLFCAIVKTEVLHANEIRAGLLHRLFG